MTSIPKRTLNMEKENMIYKKDISIYKTQKAHYSINAGLKASIHGIGALGQT